MIEQMRVRESPAVMGEEGEEVREMVAGSVHGVKYNMCLYYALSGLYTECTYSNSQCCSLSAGQCAGGGYHGDGVGGPCNQSSDGGSSGSSLSTL